MRYFVALGEDGVVVFLKPDLEFEQMAEAGLHNPEAKGDGYLNDIQQIGDRLHACGFSGQVYRREADGVWSHMDRGILQEPGPASGRFFAEAFGGASESSIYVVGSENFPGRRATRVLCCVPSESWASRSSSRDSSTRCRGPPSRGRRARLSAGSRALTSRTKAFRLLRPPALKTTSTWS